MVDRDLVVSKLGELAEHVARVRTRRTLKATRSMRARGWRADLRCRHLMDIVPT
jgi:hypothetical protein